MTSKNSATLTVVVGQIDLEPDQQLLIDSLCRLTRRRPDTGYWLTKDDTDAAAMMLVNVHAVGALHAGFKRQKRRPNMWLILIGGHDTDLIRHSFGLPSPLLAGQLLNLMDSLTDTLTSERLCRQQIIDIGRLAVQCPRHGDGDFPSGIARRL